MTKRLYPFMVTLICTIIIFNISCGNKKSDEIRIGGIFDITGATREISVAYADGIKCYIDFINKSGGINGRHIRFIDMDYGYLIPRAKTAYEILVNRDSVHAILGWGTGDTEYLRSRAAEDRIPMMSASYSAKLTLISEAPYNFLIGVTYSDQARILIKYIERSWKDRTRRPGLAFIFNETEFGKSPIGDAIDYAKNLGIEITALETVSLDAREAKEQLARIRDRRTDYVIIQETTWATSVILKDAKKMGLRAVFMGLNWSSDEKLIALAGRESEGFIGTIPFMFTDMALPGVKNILEHSRMKGLNIKDYISRYIQGWVTAMVMMEGIRMAGDDLTGPGIRKGLEKIQNYDTGGITSPVTFTDKGHVGCRSLKLGQVKDGMWQVISDYLSTD